MLEYKNCHAICTGINRPHTLQLKNGYKISIIYSDNLNQESIANNLNKNNFVLVALAYDTKGEQYQIFSSSSGIIAIKDERIKQLSIPEIIKKYHLDISEEQYKQYFNIK